MAKDDLLSRNYNAKVFISYRRSLHDIYAGRLFDRILSQFGNETKVFMDIDSIAPGEDFVEVIEAAVSTCDVLIALIGKDWLSVTDKEGNRRLDNPDDFVRLEIGAALKRKIRVIPVLVQGVEMPAKEQLPEDLRPITRRNAISISNERWNYDADRLISAIKGVLKIQPEPEPIQPALVPDNEDVALITDTGWSQMTKLSITAGLSVLIIMAIFGYLAFGENPNSNTRANVTENNNQNANATPTPRIVVLVSEAELRESPSTTGVIKSIIPKGSKVRIMYSYEDNYWHRVQVINYNYDKATPVPSPTPRNVKTTPVPSPAPDKIKTGTSGDEGYIFYDLAGAANFEENKPDNKPSNK